MVRNGEFKFLLKYKTPFVLGHDGAGVVPRVGADVQDYQVGDEVYARPRDLRIGTFAEYIAIDHADIAPKLISLTMEESAAVPLGRYPRGRRSPIWRGSRPLLKPAMALMSRKVRAQARKLGVRYSFFFMRAAGDQLKTLAALYDRSAACGTRPHVHLRRDARGHGIRGAGAREGQGRHHHAAPKHVTTVLTLRVCGPTSALRRTCAPGAHAARAGLVHNPR
jgi:hypothetical protein